MATNRSSSSNIFRTILGVAAAVAVFAVGAYVMGFRPSTDEAAGTIGSAARCRAEQLQAEDVQVEGIGGDAFLQTELFDRLVHDPAAREALTNDAFRDALTNDAFRDALTNDAFRDAFRSDAFRDAFARDAFRDALTSDAFREAFTSDAFRDALRSDAFRDALRTNAFRDALARGAD